MQAARSDRKTKENTFATALLNFLQSLGSGCRVQSAHVAYMDSAQQLRTLHHLAFSLAWQPGHRWLKYARQAPQ